MRHKIYGFEAVSSGLAKSGVTQIELALGELNSRIRDALETGRLQATVTEPLPFAEEAIGRAYFFSREGKRTACIIPEDQAYRLLPVMEENKKLKASMLVISVGNDNFDYLSKLSICGIVCWIACSPEDVVMMIYDAIKCSQFSKQATLIYIPQRVLISSQYCDMISGYRLRMMDADSQRGQQRVLSKYNRTLRDGDYAIIANSDIIEIVMEQSYGYANVAVVKLEMLDDIYCSRLLRRYKKILIIAKNKALFNLLRLDIKIQELVLNNDFLSWEKEICREILTFLEDCTGVNKHEFVEYDKEENEDRTRIRKPVFDEETGIMCPGCSLRVRVWEILADMHDKVYCEDFFCMSRASKVRSDIKHDDCKYTDNLMAGDLIFGNREGARYGRKSRAFFIGDMCRRVGSIVLNGTEKRYCTISESKCDGCMECRRVSGCPAIWSRGLKVFIDSSRCNGCGLCVRICRKGAIEYESRE